MSVSAKRDANGTWRIQFRYTDWKGEVHKTQRRGFKTKKEAEDWVNQFLLQQAGDLTMTFGEFWKIYKEDMEKRLRESTMYQKEHIVTTKLLPYFGDTPLNQITPPMIRKWQGEMMSLGYMETYLKNLNNHLTCILNYAVKYYNLAANPCRKAGSMGKSRANKMVYWTLEEFQQFLNAVSDKKISWIAFKILFWTGMRLGEMLALTAGDIDFENNTISITKSLNRMNGKDLITPPKTAQSVRTIIISEELAKDLKEYVDSLYDPSPETRIFSTITKHYLEHEIKRGIRQSGVKKITVPKILHAGGSASAIVTPAEGLCPEDEYIGFDGLRYCSRCHAKREIRVKFYGKERIFPALCKCQEEERDRRAREQEQRDFQLRRERLREDGLEDKAYYDYCFSKDNKRNPQMKHAYTYVENWETMKEDGTGLLIWGDTGTGKSFMAGCIANALIDQCIPVIMTNLTRILNKVTGTFGDERNQAVSRMNRSSLLIIDDLGTERETEFAMEQIFNVIDSRYRSRKPMIICTNLQLTELKNPKDLDHKRIYERILEHTIPIKCNDINFREENAKKTMQEALQIFH